tara:strand:- start:60 stop:791 length:732 start_codon:yes stop_codon:yes gene_type:complete
MAIPAVAYALPYLAKGLGSYLNYKGQQKSLDEAKKKTPEEQEYLRRLNERREKGSMDVPKLTNQVSQGAYQAGAFAKQNVYGNIVSKGMEKSIVADELRRKTDVDTLKTIAQESRKIALANEATKKSAEGEYDQYLLNRSDMLKNIASKRAGLKGQLYGDLAGTVAGGMGAYMSNIPEDAVKMPEDVAKMPWEGMHQGDFMKMPTEAGDQYFDALSDEQKLMFIKWMTSAGALFDPETGERKF